MKTKYLVIQPHSNDALFSVSHLLLDNVDKEVEVLTVEGNNKRILEDNELSELIGIKFHNLGIEFVDDCYKNFWKNNKEVNVQNAKEFLANFHGKSRMDKLKERLQNWILKHREKNNCILVVPCGFGEPFHLFVRYTIEEISNYCLYYREFPHSYKKRIQPQVQQFQKQYKQISCVELGELHDLKWEIAKKIYKSQSGTIWYEQDYIRKQLPEELYETTMPF